MDSQESTLQVKHHRALTSIMRDFRSSILVFSLGLLAFGVFMGGWAIASGQILLFLVCLSTLFVRPSEGNDWIRPLKNIPRSTFGLIAVLLVSLSSCLVIADSPGAALHLAKKLRYLFFPILLILFAPCYHLISRNRTPTAQLGVLGLSLGIVLSTVSGLIGHFTGFNPLLLGDQPYPTRNGGIYGMVMTYAYAMGIALLPLISLGLNPPLRQRLFPERNSLFITSGVWLTIITGMTGLYFSYTRGAVLGLIAGIAVLLVIQRKWKWFIGIATLGLIVLTLSIASGSRFVSLKQRNQLLTTSHSERYSQWKTALGIFIENPITGVGYRQFFSNSVDYKKRHSFPKDQTRLVAGKPVSTWQKSHAHNNLLEHLASTGIIGGLSFAAFCFFWTTETWKSPLSRILFFPAIISFLLSGMFENTFFDSEVITVILICYVSSLLLSEEPPAE